MAWASWSVRALSVCVAFSRFARRFGYGIWMHGHGASCLALIFTSRHGRAGKAGKRTRCGNLIFSWHQAGYR
ncbi:hypothetical protein K491DRAFT_90033 [Lophiostoma macrostomum CBS 122681]|uniref:Secreted protein n=1 Tax=Lophiostoma macrostomum CBS 122681 TaxID=1314788 RepID=A0A6A6SV61_9PLEO|nr:hypothetical protein K491DRAFT_90033 [Lophiostoma macrostomum CBS 122681]